MISYDDENEILEKRIARCIKFELDHGGSTLAAARAIIQDISSGYIDIETTQPAISRFCSCIVYKDATKKAEDFRGWFHQWGTAFIEFESGPGNYTTAIIERQSGEIESVSPERIQFIRYNDGPDSPH